MLLIITDFDDTPRLNGQARLVTDPDPDLLSSMAANGRTPKLAIVVHVAEVFLHCAKAFRRSGLWGPTQHLDRHEMPSLLKIILDQTTGTPADAAEMQKITRFWMRITCSRCIDRLAAKPFHFMNV